MSHDLSPLEPSAFEITCAIFALLSVTLTIVTLIMIVKNERNLTHRILAALVVCCFPLLGSVGYLLWRRRTDPPPTTI